MKKPVIFILSAVVALLAVGCGSEGNSADAAPAEQQEAFQEVSARETDAQGTTAQQPEAFSAVTAVDNEECAVIIRGIEPSDLFGYTLKAELENKAADKTYMFSVEMASINGVMCDPLFASEVSPGMKSNVDITFPMTKLEDNGVGEPTDIEMTFRVYDSNDWMADDYVNQSVTLTT